MAARRAALAAACACARPGCVADRPPRDLARRARASPADEGVTELDSIPAGRINQIAPIGITDFRAGAFPQGQRPPADSRRQRCADPGANGALP
jgi:hypothetical protein